MKFEHTSRDVLNVSRRAAEIILERRQEIIRPPLRELDVDINAKTVTLRGKREGIIFAQTTIREIEEEVAQEVTEQLSVDTFLHDIIKSDPQAWTDIVARCRGLACANTKGQCNLLDV
jgi:hypothetical protein